MSVDNPLTFMNGQTRMLLVRRLTIPWMIWLLLGECLLPTLGIAEDSIAIESVQVYPSPTGSRIVLQTSAPMAVLTYTLTNPDRLIVDPIESSVVTTVSSKRTLSTSGIVIGWELVTSQAGVDYLVFPVALPVQATVYQADRIVTIEVTPVTPMVDAPTVASEVPSALSPEAASLASPPTTADQPLTVSQALAQSLAVYEPARIALEESEVAMLKVKEARRNLFPGASLRGTMTNGVASGAQFREAQAGLQIEHPLYDTGRLRDTYRQALVNLQITQKRYEKVRADFAFDVAQAYYELLAAHQSVVFRERLLAETERIAETARQRFEAGLVTKMEWLNIQSQRAQARFQLQGARNDVAISELKFRHRMNWSAPLPVTLPRDFPEEQPQVELPEALRVARTNRPDVQINTLLVEFHKYEERLAQEKTGWKLDLTGFLGTSAGAFQTEPLTFNNDYSIALKVSKPWGPNTSSVTVSKVATSPRVGQTTRTSSDSLQGEIGLLNGLSGATEIKQATVGRLKAQEDLAETQRTLEQEVTEAYYAYQKAILTLEHAQQREQYRLEQVKILRAQAELNEVLPSQILEVELQLSDDQVSQIQARASYHTALARLNKAIGVTSYY